MRNPWRVTAPQMSLSSDASLLVLSSLLVLGGIAATVVILRRAHNPDHLEAERLQRFAHPTATFIIRCAISVPAFISGLFCIIGGLLFHPLFWVCLAVIVALFGACVYSWIRSRGLPAIAVDGLDESAA